MKPKFELNACVQIFFTLDGMVISMFGPDELLNAFLKMTSNFPVILHMSGGYEKDNKFPCSWRFGAPF